MRFFPTIVLVGLLAVSDRASGETPATPILIDLYDADPPVVQLAGKQRNVDEVMAWLRDVSDKFGRSDPVIVRLDSNQNIIFAAKLALISTVTHENVFIGLVNPDSKESSLYLIPISSKKVDFQISAIGESIINSTIPTPSRQIDSPKQEPRKNDEPKKIIIHTMERNPNLPTGPPYQYKGGSMYHPVSDEFLEELEERVKTHK